jgi:hypothetical protein
VDFSNIKYMGPWAGNNSGGRPFAEFLFDELRVGTTWEDVTPGGAESPKWVNWNIEDGKNVGTGTFLGWFDISLDPWIYSYELEQFIHIPSNSFSDKGAWVFVPTMWDPPAGGEGTWAGYIVEDEYADTGDFLGLVYVGDAPWVYSMDMGKWLYLPEATITSPGAWMFVPLED